MNIVLWIGSGANQTALANKLHREFPVKAIVVEQKKSKSNLSFQNFSHKIIERTFVPVIANTWKQLLADYRKEYPQLPAVEVLHVSNINAPEVLKFTKEAAPDLILVSGTRLISKGTLSIKPSLGILNFHTGLSPYIKGGPNCTNWCIATQQPHLIGNTIMWIDEGIDSGNILVSELTPLEGTETFRSLHRKVMEHGHSLYLQAVRFLQAGFRQSIPQSSICAGKTYYSRHWNLKQKIKTVINYKKLRKGAFRSLFENRSHIVTVPLEKPGS